MGLPKNLTERQQKFAELLVFNEGRKSPSECAYEAGYKTRPRQAASELRNPKLSPLVVKYIGELRAEIQEKYKDTENSDLSESLGGIVGDEIIINKDLAKTRVYGDNVGNHELLHGIIKASKADITQDTINDFLDIIGEENKAIVQKRIDKNYTPEYMAKNLDEYFLNVNRRDRIPRSDIISIIENVEGIDSVNVFFIS